VGQLHFRIFHANALFQRPAQSFFGGEHFEQVTRVLHTEGQAQPSRAAALVAVKNLLQLDEVGLS
jgi:hypothetical protein